MVTHTFGLAQILITFYTNSLLSIKWIKDVIHKAEK